MKTQNVIKKAESAGIELSPVTVMIKARPSKRELETTPKTPSEAIATMKQNNVSIFAHYDALVYIKHAIKLGIIKAEDVLVIVVENARRRATNNWVVSKITNGGVFTSEALEKKSSQFMEPELLPL